MDFIDKIARMITDDPDTINESDESERRLERARIANPGDHEARKRHRHALERRKAHGEVTIDGILNFYEKCIGHSFSEIMNSAETPIWVTNPSRADSRLADHLMEYAPNFNRKTIPRIIKLIKELWVDTGKIDYLQEELNANQAGDYRHNWYVQLSDSREELIDVLQDYIVRTTDQVMELRNRLERLLNQETTPYEYPEEYSVWRSPEGSPILPVSLIQRRINMDAKKYLTDEESQRFKADMLEWARQHPIDPPRRMVSYPMWDAGAAEVSWSDYRSEVRDWFDRNRA